MPGDLAPLAYDPSIHDLSFTQKRLKEDLDLDRHQRRIVFYLVIAALIIATLGSAFIAFLVTANADNTADKEWARNILASVIAGMVGYAFGKK